MSHNLPLASYTVPPQTPSVHSYRWSWPLRRGHGPVLGGWADKIRFFWTPLHGYWSNTVAEPVTPIWAFRRRRRRWDTPWVQDWIWTWTWLYWVVGYCPLYLGTRGSIFRSTPYPNPTHPTHIRDREIKKRWSLLFILRICMIYYRYTQSICIG